MLTRFHHAMSTMFEFFEEAEMAEMMKLVLMKFTSYYCIT